MTTTKRIAILAPALLLAGCATWSTETKYSEGAWQALHAADVAQTLQIARNPDCFYEKDPVTSRLIGKHPSQGAVLAWGAGTAAAHAIVTHELEKHDAPRWVRRTWQAVTIGGKAQVVGANWSIGLRFGGVEKQAGCRGPIIPESAH